MGVDLGKRAKILGIIEEKISDAWMEQHIHIIKKWLNQAVFATPHSIQKPPQINKPKICILGVCRAEIFVLYCDCRRGKPSDKN